MGRKCIPGVICIENMTLFMMFVIFILVVYMFMRFRVSPVAAAPSSPIIQNIYQGPAISGLGIHDTFNDPYAPPLRNDGLWFRNDLPITNASMFGVSHIAGSGNRGVILPPVAAVGIPVNVQTRGVSTEYTQIGILTRDSGGEMILPLMGRRVLNGRDRYQYYTISNSGNLNTKLPIKVRGKSCTGEYGCDSIMSGDIVYVEGYKETFQATVYENSLLNYIPYL